MLIYNGQDDLIVTSPGTMKWVESIFYKEGPQFRDTLLENWKVKDKVAGRIKKAGKLEFRIVFNAGHMVPMDQPENALDMVTSFVEQHRTSAGVVTE